MTLSSFYCLGFAKIMTIGNVDHVGVVLGRFAAIVLEGNVAFVLEEIGDDVLEKMVDVVLIEIVGELEVVAVIALRGVVEYIQVGSEVVVVESMEFAAAMAAREVVMVKLTAEVHYFGQ